MIYKTKVIFSLFNIVEAFPQSQKLKFREELLTIDKSSIKIEGPLGSQTLDEITYRTVANIINRYQEAV